MPEQDNDVTGGHGSLRHRDLRTTVERECPAGHALVLRCHPVRMTVRGPEPFPTLFWLACPEVARRVAGLERDGGVGALEGRLARDPELAARVAADHRAYIDARLADLSAAERDALMDAGRLDDLRTRGIGGIRDFNRVKCLHLHAAHHLARGSALGALIADACDLRPCARDGSGARNATGRAD